MGELGPAARSSLRREGRTWMSVPAVLAVSPCLLKKAGSCCSTGVRLVACSSLDLKTRTFSCSTKKKKKANPTPPAPLQILKYPPSCRI